ncbi:MAG: triose-phosphate isomerase [Proteobacteria bacterium]|nr:triose-phosphate isomerase [Pseudomonadota bacterium]MBU1712594.1 triose-phosphate isomerase [Pseudomonadota bacterium]
MSKRKPFIAGNWKMYKTSFEAVETARKLVRILKGINHVDIMIAPPFTALAAVYEVVKESSVMVGAQNLFWEKEGAYTGEISPGMIVSSGCRYVIIGHSERRQYFGETDCNVNKKIRAALNNSLVPVICIGETEKERDEGDTFNILDKQIKMGLEGFSPDDLKHVILAYEPVWAIGTGKTATSDQAQEVHRFLRSLIENLFGKKIAGSVRILYGGSVKPENIGELMLMPDIDGALVGGASLDAEKFAGIINFKI